MNVFASRVSAANSTSKCGTFNTTFKTFPKHSVMLHDRSAIMDSVHADTSISGFNKL